MRVALFSRNACDGDAIGQQVAAKLAYFQQRGAEVRVFLNEIHQCRSDITENLLIIATAEQVWRDHAQRDYLVSCDLILAEFGSSYDLLDLLPALVGEGPRIIIDYHGVTPQPWADRSLQGDIDAACRQRSIVWSADVVLVKSQFAADELRQATGLPEERIQQLPCWMKPVAIQDDKQVAALRRRHVLGSSKVLLFVGRFARNKQPERLIEALPLLDQETVAVFLGAQQDIYRERLLACQQLAVKLGVADRVKFVGKVTEEELSAWYNAASVMVLPSKHECFGMPVVEAMQRGIPVIGTNAGSLPEVIEHAGLLADADNSQELAHLVKRYTSPGSNPATRRVALVTHRFGTHFAGGAEQSLRLMAQALQSQGYEVEVFTTCNEDASRWANTLPAGTTKDAGFLVHRFQIDAHDPVQLGEAYQRIVQASGQVTPTIETHYLQHSLGSEALVAALGERRDQFAAILTGPYLFKLTHQVAQAFGEQVLLAPCFHDEPLAQLDAFKQAYRQVGGLLFHTTTEARWTATRLAIAQPRHTVVGTILNSDAQQADASLAQKRFGSHYLVYCGRYCPEKGVNRLIDYVEKMHTQGSCDIKLVCLGQGPMKLPARPWLIDAGFVTEQEKRNILAGALALVNLSRNESLSIVVLEAWALGVPVIVDAGCAVLCEQVNRCAGGIIVQDAEQLANVVHHWLANPAAATERGEAGKRLVEQEYLSASVYAKRLSEVVESMQIPLSEIASAQGLKRAAELWTPEKWEDRMSNVVEQTQLASPVIEEHHVDIELLTKKLQIQASSSSGTVSFKVHNHGKTLLPATGPVVGSVHLKIKNEQKKRAGSRVKVPLSQAIMPGESPLMVAALEWPTSVGKYRIKIQVKLGKRTLASAKMTLLITEGAPTLGDDRTALGPIMQSARQALAEARHWEVLPEDYCDVSEGKLANFKKMLKQKLLHNFRKAYVDVAFRQQSTLNRKLIAVMSLMLESVSSQDVAGQQAQLARRLATLEEKLKLERRHRRLLQQQLAALASPADTLLEGNPT